MQRRPLVRGLNLTFAALLPVWPFGLLAILTAVSRPGAPPDAGDWLMLAAVGSYPLVWAAACWLSRTASRSPAWRTAAVWIAAAPAVNVLLAFATAKASFWASVWG